MTAFTGRPSPVPSSRVRRTRGLLDELSLKGHGFSGAEMEFLRELLSPEGAEYHSLGRSEAESWVGLSLEPESL